MSIMDTHYLCKTPKAIQKLISRLENRGFKVRCPIDLNKEYVFIFRTDTLCVDYISYEWYKRYKFFPTKKLVEFKEED